MTESAEMAPLVLALFFVCCRQLGRVVVGWLGSMDADFVQLTPNRVAHVVTQLFGCTIRGASVYKQHSR